METIKTLLDQAKAQKSVSTDYALAKSLHVPTQRISDYYKGTRTPDEFACLQIAKAIGKSYEEVSAIVRIEAEKDESRRQAWRDYYKSIGGYAASVMLMFFFTVTLIVTPTPAEASNSKVSQAQHFVLCKVVAVFKKAAAFVRHTISSAFPRFCFLG